VGFTSTGSLEVYNVLRIYGASIGLASFATAKRYYSDINPLANNLLTWNSIAGYTQDVSNSKITSFHYFSAEFS
jgi:hypothetical protein